APPGRNVFSWCWRCLSACCPASRLYVSVWRSIGAKFGCSGLCLSPIPGDSSRRLRSRAWSWLFWSCMFSRWCAAVESTRPKPLSTSITVTSHSGLRLENLSLRHWQLARDILWVRKTHHSKSEPLWLPLSDGGSSFPEIVCVCWLQSALPQG